MSDSIDATNPYRARTPWGSPEPVAPTAAAPIGVFDSGVGGLTVARAIMDQLPHERIIYVGDTAHGPYGPLKIAEVRANALRIMDELVDSGVKMLVIACNTASAAVLRDARERYTRQYGIPVIEVIQPAARRALAATRNRKIGVIATEATVTSRAYEDTFAITPNLQVYSVACPRLRPRTAGDRSRVPAAAQGCRGRHARARMHPLPVAGRRDFLHYGRGRHPCFLRG